MAERIGRDLVPTLGEAGVLLGDYGAGVGH